jgi:hypothetical protein
VSMAGERSDAPTGAGPNKAAVKKHDVFGITEVDAEEWETWLQGNKDSNLVKKHFLFAAPRHAGNRSADHHPPQGEDVARPAAYLKKGGQPTRSCPSCP